MKVLYIFLFTFISTSSICAEKPKVKFGKVALTELQESNYALDPNAEAIMLYEKGVTNFGYDENEGIFLETEYFFKKKILKNSALDQGIIKITYIQNYNEKSQTVMNIKGNSYWIENGGFNKKALTENDIFDEKLNKKYSQKRISFPQVKPGSIIEYSYVIRTPLNVKDKPENWYFQGDIPKLWSEYEIAIPSYLFYQITMGGSLPLVLKDQTRTQIGMGHSKLDAIGLKYNFAVANAPAMKSEPFMSSVLNYISKVEFELSSTSIPTDFTKNYSTTWNDVNSTLDNSDYFGKRIRKSDFLKNTVPSFETETNKIVRLEKIYYHMLELLETDFSYNSIYADDLKRAFENKKATPTEKNLMLVGLLQNFGYNAYPVITSTRENGKINKNFPLLDRFNYTLCMVELNSKNYFLDLSKPQQKFGMVPYECLNEDGRLISLKNSQFVSISPTENYKYTETLNLKLDKSSGKISGNYENLGFGYYALNVISDFQNLGKEKYIEKLKAQNQGIKTSDFEFANFNNVKNFPTVKFNLQTEDLVNNEDMIYLNPLIIGKIKENIFKLDKRAFPVDFGYGQEITTKINLEIPDNFSCASFPKNVNIDAVNGNVLFTYTTRFDEDTHQIVILSKIVFKNTNFSPEKYQELKDFYGQIIQKHDEMIVLKRK